MKGEAFSFSAERPLNLLAIVEVVVGLSTFPFIRAEVAHCSSCRIGIKYDCNARLGGTSHFNAYGMARFAIAGILTSTTVPLRMAHRPLDVRPRSGLRYGAAVAPGSVR